MTNFENIKGSELQPGHIYVTSPSLLGDDTEGWRCTYLYLGRNAQKQYVWLFVDGLHGWETVPDVYACINYWANRSDNVKTNDAFVWTKAPKKVYKMRYYTKWNAFVLNYYVPYLSVKSCNKLKEALAVSI